MKSRLKIDYERGVRNNPVIKIITPPDPSQLPTQYPSSNEDIEEDVQDRLVKDLLHSPCMCEPNSLFEVKTTFSLDGGSRLTTIGAIQEEDLLYTFRHAILNRYVPYNDIVDMNREFNLFSRSAIRVNDASSKNKNFGLYQKIHQFFNWLDETEQASWGERRPYIGPGKQVCLKDVGTGNSFTFGGIKMIMDKASNDQEGMIFCQIYGQEAYVYISETTIVEIEN